MRDWSRRHVLRATAGTAIAVPMAALGGGLAGATEPAETTDRAAAPGRQWSTDPTADAGPVMFCIHDAQRGEVSILHGTDEVIIHDRQLVTRILQAANSSSTSPQRA